MASATDQKMTDRRLGDFAIGRELGRGGMGVVYEAQQISLNRKVALKVLASELGLTSNSVERFHREAEAAAKLHHSNIVPIYATGEQDGAYFFAMELIEGASLDRVLNQLRQDRAQPAKDTPAPAALTPQTPSTPADVECTAAYIDASQASSASGISSTTLNSGSGYFDNVARMIAEVADALGHAHQSGVIHRDIKPSNLLLGNNGRLSVNDFGLARMLEKPGMTVTGEFVGTPAYMSPEQITAGRVPLDHRSDIYSLGATLYELLTLQRPFRGEGRDQVLAQILQKDPVSPRKIDKKIPLDLETICLKAMDKDPDRRYQQAGEMAEDLRRYVNRFAIMARRAGPVGRTVKMIRRHPAVTALLVCLSVALVAAGFFAYQHHREGQQRLAEQQQNAIDKAQLSTMSGDFDAARQAIDEAERLGATPAQIHMVRGQIDLNTDKVPDAIEHFKKAAELLPDSVAARALLTLGYVEAGEFALFTETISQALNLVPVTAEDYLFLGMAESIYHPEKGVQLLETAMQKRGSVIFRLAHAGALTQLARDVGDLDMALQAAREGDLVKQLLPDNPVALRYALQARTIAIHEYRLPSQKSDRDATIALARKDADALKRFPQYPYGLSTRWQFLRELDELDTLLDELDKAKPGPNTEAYAYTLYRRGEFDKARAVAARSDGVGTMYLVLIAAEFPDRESAVMKIYQNDADNPRTSKWTLATNQLALLLLGKHQESRAACQSYLDRRLTSPFKDAELQRAYKYLAGSLSAEAYLKAAGRSRVDQTNVHYFVGLTELAHGNREAAREHFRQAIATGGFEYDHYELSWALLGRMERDPLWPPWIPAMK
jgi:serine/threonine protein kinase